MRLIVLANREPVRRVAGGWQVSVGGLAAALYPALRVRGGTWVAWDPGGEGGTVVVDGLRVVRVPLFPREVAMYYGGMANRSLWPLAHGFLEKFEWKRAWWSAYEAVNRRFSEAALDEGDGVFWVHDYHLSLVPRMIRERRAGVRIGFFWHIPWPSLDIFSALPAAAAVIEGILGSDLVGFHTPDDVRHFQEAAAALLGAEVGDGFVRHQGRTVRVMAHPIGIDTEEARRLRQAAAPKARAIREAAGGRLILVGADRLDYTKGIVERLEGFSRFLARYPRFRERVRLFQLTTPSRTSLPAYRELKKAIFAQVKAISRRFPGALVHRYETLGRDDLFAYYRAADAALVTPLRDGMNLVVQEYVVGGAGLPLLSRFAGAARYFPEAVMVNPYDTEGLAEAIFEALSLAPEDRDDRRSALVARARALDVNRWRDAFVGALVGEGR